MSDVAAGSGVLQVGIRVVTYPDRPGISKIFAGEMLLFDGDGAEGPITDVTIHRVIPFHTHFTESTFTLAWRRPT